MTEDQDFIHKELTYKIIGCAMEVHRQLGYGFLEKVYENALMILLEREKLNAHQQHAIPVYFEDRIVGEYFADILVDNKVIVEIKTVEHLNNAHTAQVLNYLTQTDRILGRQEFFQAADNSFFMAIVDHILNLLTPDDLVHPGFELTH
ncbi:MAG: GxxExxY protein, partial [Planctomycetaceae bacterium]|nr:GxxExxY protein [Planctomycetaceae bacterium]